MKPMFTTPVWESFDSWADLRTHIQAGEKVWYHAPMDYRPVLVRVRVLSTNRVRVYPPYRDTDPFTADPGHLARFRKEQP